MEAKKGLEVAKKGELLEKEEEVHKAPEAVYYWRLNLYHRYLHGMVIVSFLGLVATGMPLKFSHTRWAVWLSHFLGGFETAGFFHRVFALMTFLYFGLHLGYVAYLLLVRKETGLFWGPNSMVPQPKDFIEIYQHFRWFLGLGPRPRFDRWTYWEKFDYWAVFWGIAIIGSSGLFLWFPTFFARFFPGWVFNIALIVHSDEALLAAAFIFTVHFFNTHLRPESFPFDPVIFTGRVREEELIKKHPVEYERMVLEGTLERFRAEPPPLWLRNFSWIVGFSALGIGLVLLFLIVLTLFR